MQLDLQKMQAEKKAQESGAQRQRMEMKSAAAKEAGPTGKKDISGPEEGSKVLKCGCECSWSCAHTTHFARTLSGTVISVGRLDEAERRQERQRRKNEAERWIHAENLGEALVHAGGGCGH